MLGDFVFLGKDENILLPTAPSHVVQYVIISWQRQNNRKNGEEITFARDDTKPKYSPFRAAHRNCQRARRLRVSDNEPMGVFHNSKGTRRFITDAIATKFLRSEACKVLKLNASDPQLKLWSTHSIRVKTDRMYAVNA